MANQKPVTVNDTLLTGNSPPGKQRGKIKAIEPMDNVVIYIRVSTDRQAEEGTSLTTQEEKCREYAAKHELNLIKIFREEGESAKAWQRPVLMEMLDYLKANKGKIKYLIVYKLDRLSRNTDDQYAIMFKLSQADVQLCSATENIDNTPSGKLTRTMLWAIAEFDNAVRAERVKDGMHARFKEGYWPFGTPSGYIRVKDDKLNRSLLTPHPEYGPMVAWAAEQRAAGMSYHDITRGLKTRGFMTSHSQPPNEQRTGEMLRNPIYYGLMRAFGEQLDGKHEKLISYDLYLKMRVVDGEGVQHNHKKMKNNPAFPLVHTLTCSQCGKELRGSFSRGKLGKRYPYYHHHNKDCAAGKSYPRDAVHSLFVQLLGELQPTEKNLKLFRAVVLDVAKTKAEQQATDGKRFEKQINELRKQREKIVTSMLNDPSFDLLPREEYLQRKQTVEQQIEAVKIERAKFETVEVNINQFLDRCIAVITDPAKTWQGYVTEHQKEFQRDLFPSGLQFDGKSYRTLKKSLVLATIEEAQGNKSRLVTLRRIELRFPP